MRIIQLTDPHIPNGTGEEEVSKSLQLMIEQIDALDPNLLVVTGDLAADKGGLSIYQWMRSLLGNKKASIRYLPGNHDVSAEMALAFEASELPVRSSVVKLEWFDHLPFLFLDTSAGFVTAEHLELTAEILNQLQCPVLLFLHHPVLSVPISHMERNYPLKGRDPLVAVLHDGPVDTYLFCGHYHAEFTVANGSIHQFVTPSAWYQIAPYRDGFQRDHHHPGFRVIDWDGKLLQTTVRYLP